MLGYDGFKKWFDELCEDEKREVLRDMFDVENVSVYSFSKRENQIVVQLYAENVFYLFTFIYDDKVKDGVRVESQMGSRFVIKRIYIGKNFLKDQMETVKTSEN